MPAMPVRFDHSEESDLGSMRNHLGFLTPDFAYFIPETLTAHYANVSDLSSLLGIGRTQLYKDRLLLKKGSKLRQTLLLIVMATDLAYELLSSSQEKAIHWLLSPNMTFFGESPLDIILREEGTSVISWLQERHGLKSGSAF